MERLFRLINQRLHESLRAGEAGRLAGLSEGAFNRCYRRHTGRTFPDLVNQLRIGRAGRLLAENDAKIIDIAYACGFPLPFRGGLALDDRRGVRQNRLT